MRSLLDANGNPIEPGGGFVKSASGLMIPADSAAGRAAVRQQEEAKKGFNLSRQQQRWLGRRTIKMWHSQEQRRKAATAKAEDMTTTTAIMEQFGAAKPVVSREDAQIAAQLKAEMGL